jgi:hypothetical protein
VSIGSGWLFLVLVVLGILAILVAPFLAIGTITFLRLMKKGSKK